MTGMMPQMPMQAPQQGASPYPQAQTTDPMASMNQLPNLPPEVLLMLLSQADEPMEAAMGSRQAGPPQPDQSALLSALMQFGMMPPQSVPPQAGY